MEIMSVWGYPTNPHYNPDKFNNGGSYWQWAGGAVIAHNNKIIVIELDNNSIGDFGTRWSLAVSVPGYRWCVNYGSANDASIGTPEDIDAVCASIEGALGLDIREVVHNIAPVIDIAAWSRWCAINNNM